MHRVYRTLLLSALQQATECSGGSRQREGRGGAPYDSPAKDKVGSAVCCVLCLYRSWYAFALQPNHDLRALLLNSRYFLCCGWQEL